MQGTGSLTIYAGQTILVSAEGSLTTSGSSGGQAKLSGATSLYTYEFNEFVSDSLSGSSNLFIEPSTIPHGSAWLHEVMSIGGDTNYAISRQSLQPLYSYSNDEYVPAMPDYGIAWVTPIASWGYAEGAAGEGVTNISALVSRSGDYNYSIGSAFLPRFVSLGIFGDDHEATVYEYVKAWDGFGAASDTIVFIFESPSLAHSSSAGRLAYDEFVSSGAIDGSTTSTSSRIVTVYSTGEVVEFYASDRLAQEQFIQDIIATGSAENVAVFYIDMNCATSISGSAETIHVQPFVYNEVVPISGTVEALVTWLVTVSEYVSAEESLNALRIQLRDINNPIVTNGVINTFVSWLQSASETASINATIGSLVAYLYDISEQVIVEGSCVSFHEFLVEFFSYTLLSDTAMAVRKTGGNWEIPGISDSRTWAVNLDTGTSSQYDGYGYNSFFERDGKYYGVADDGIYLLEGEKDAGKSIAALLDQGLSDYGTFHTKKATDVYIACASGGRLQLKVVVDGVEKVYQANSHSNTIKEHRVQISRSQLGSEWQLVWSNQGGDDFDISEIDFHIFPMNRRIR